jgi:hypothetical protein
MTRAQADARYVRVLTQHGCRKGLARVLVSVCRQLGAPISLAAALVFHESGFRKVWGHDPPPNGGRWGGWVTMLNYIAYKRRRGPGGRGGMQGCGETQLTWYAFQDEADRLGGCWRARPNVLVGVGHAWTLVKRNGWHAGLRAYNGTGPAAEQYARTLRSEVDAWHKRLTEATT